MIRKAWLFILVFAFFVNVIPQKTQAEPEREFIMSCSYGVLAGTLLGAASLAFAKKPGDNLGNIARGASLGLYAGILLGIYVTQIVPRQLEEEAKAREEELSMQEMPKWIITPSSNLAGKVDGAQIHINVLEF